MNAAGWTNALTFTKFYKPVIAESGMQSDNFGHNLLQLSP